MSIFLYDIQPYKSPHTISLSLSQHWNVSLSHLYLRTHPATLYFQVFTPTYYFTHTQPTHLSAFGCSLYSYARKLQHTGCHPRPTPTQSQFCECRDDVDEGRTSSNWTNERQSVFKGKKTGSCGTISGFIKRCQQTVKLWQLLPDVVQINHWNCHRTCVQDQIHIFDNHCLEKSFCI